MRNPHTRRALKLFVTIAWPLVAILRGIFHPEWGGGLSGLGALASTSCMVGLIRTSGCRHYIAAGRHAVERPSPLERVTLTRALWGGFAAGWLLMFASAPDLHHLQAVFNVGGWLVVMCPCALGVRWLFGRQARRHAGNLAEPVMREVEEIRSELGGIRRGLLYGNEHAQDVEEQPEPVSRPRLYAVPSTGTGPQRAGLCGPLASAAVAAAAALAPHLLGPPDEGQPQLLVAGQVRVGPDPLQGRAEVVPVPGGVQRVAVHPVTVASAVV